MDHEIAINDRLRQAGFVLSLLAICGVCLVGPFGDVATLVGITFACLSLPGIFLSGLALRHAPRRLAVWGLLIGCASALYLPTFWLALLRYIEST